MAVSYVATCRGTIAGRGHKQIDPPGGRAPVQYYNEPTGWRQARSLGARQGELGRLGASALLFQGASAYRQQVISFLASKLNGRHSALMERMRAPIN